MLNQTQFNSPGGSGVDISPISGAMNEFFNARKGKGKELERMAGQYALDTMRDTRKFAQTKELEQGRQTFQTGMQERGLAATAKEGSATRRQETRMAKLTQEGSMDGKRLDIAGRVVTQNNAFAGITSLGKTKRVDNFALDKDGGMNATFNKPVRRRRSSITPGVPTQVEPTTPPRATEAPPVPTGTTTVAPAIRDPKTGRATRNPAYTSSKPAPTTKPRRKP